MGPCVRRDDPLIARAKPIVSTRGSIHPYAIALPARGQLWHIVDQSPSDIRQCSGPGAPRRVCAFAGWSA